MLIPEEKPYMNGLNSYYIAIDRFIEHLQGEIGSGCLYCHSVKEEVLIYFDEQDVIRAVIQKKGKPACTCRKMDAVIKLLATTNFLLTVYALDPNAVFFWGQMPPFKRGKKILTSKDIRLPDLVFRLNSKKLYGFVQVETAGQKERAIIFLHKGSRIGGSYSWGTGGLDTSDAMYNQLVKSVQDTSARFRIGHFLAQDHATAPGRKDAKNTVPGTNIEIAELDRALELFLDRYVQVVRQQSKGEPIVLLKQEFIDQLEKYPFLDPFKDIFTYLDGQICCSDEIGRESIAEGVVDCVWNVVKTNKLENAFRAALSGCESKDILAACNIKVAR